MAEVNYDMMSNSELKIKLTEMENEYENLKVKMNILVNRMEELDNTYVKVKKILNKRTKGRMV
jgi:uncharacterized coiled-coil protein SlyX